MDKHLPQDLMMPLAGSLTSELTRFVCARAVCICVTVFRFKLSRSILWMIIFSLGSFEGVECSESSG